MYELISVPGRAVTREAEMKLKPTLINETLNSSVIALGQITTGVTSYGAIFGYLLRKTVKTFLLNQGIFEAGISTKHTNRIECKTYFYQRRSIKR